MSTKLLHGLFDENVIDKMSKQLSFKYMMESFVDSGNKINNELLDLINTIRTKFPEGKCFINDSYAYLITDNQSQIDKTIDRYDLFADWLQVKRYLYCKFIENLVLDDKKPLMIINRGIGGDLIDIRVYLYDEFPLFFSTRKDLMSGWYFPRISVLEHKKTQYETNFFDNTCTIGIFELTEKMYSELCEIIDKIIEDYYDQDF